MSMRLRSWVESANEDGTDFPLANLPMGVVDRGDGSDPVIAVPIGNKVLIVPEAIQADALDGITPETACALSSGTLNQFAGMGKESRVRFRKALQSALAQGNVNAQAAITSAAALLDADAVTSRLPFQIGDYTDFYASAHHATNVGRMFRPDGEPLLPNWKHLPVGYHGRASSIVTSGTPVRRPHGQTMGAEGPPSHGPSRLLDYELEVGFFIGKASQMGEPVAIADALDHVFGMVLVNDWSARDVQKWEYQPLGPFNAKNFATSISPWVITMEALEPFLVKELPRSESDPAHLEYLDWADDVLVDLGLQVSIRSSTMRNDGMEGQVLSTGNYRDMYWSMAQMIAHHTSTGCNLNPGDLMASGTVSGPEESSRGCLLELTWRGENPVALADGTERKFLQDGDELTIRGWCEGDHADRIGFGSCSGVVLPAR